jgi:uncharacterized protein (DUF697 family)
MAIEPKYKKIIIDSARTAAAAAGPGTFIPVLDTGVVAGVWANMLIKIAKISGHDLDFKFAIKMATVVATGVSGYVAGSKLFTYGLLLIPGVGWLTAMGINGMLNYIFTFKLGKVAKNMFEKPGFDAGDATDIAKSLILPLLSIPTFTDIQEMI